MGPIGWNAKELPSAVEIDLVAQEWFVQFSPTRTCVYICRAMSRAQCENNNENSKYKNKRSSLHTDKGIMDRYVHWSVNLRRYSAQWISISWTVNYFNEYFILSNSIWKFALLISVVVLPSIFLTFFVDGQSKSIISFVCVFFARFDNSVSHCSLFISGLPTAVAPGNRKTRVRTLLNLFYDPLRRRRAILDSY